MAYCVTRSPTPACGGGTVTARGDTYPRRGWDAGFIGSGTDDPAHDLGST
jgi:hypothetical protein